MLHLPRGKLPITDMKAPLLKSPSLRITRRRESGSATLAALGILAVTLLVLSTALIEASHRYRTSHQSTRWAQAGQAAEAGADIAMNSAQNGSWVADGWSAAPGSPGSAAITKTFTVGISAPDSGPITAAVSVDEVSVGGSNYLRIQSIGSTTVYGGSVSGIDDNDVMLRKLSFRFNRYTGASMSTPQSMRMVEILAKPKSPFTMALLLNNQLTMSGGGVIDSFDSSNSAKSTNGLYDQTKRQTNAKVGINNTQGQTDLKGTYVYGSLAYSGTTPSNDGNVTGGVTSPFSKPITAVTAPTWSSYNATPTIINNSATLTGGTQSSPALYKVSSLTVAGGKSLTLAPYAAGQQSYMEIWVTGDFTTSGSGFIDQQAGVHVTYHIQGSLTVSGSSFNNEGGIAANNTIDMMNPPTGVSQKVTVSGGGTFIGVIDAPGADFDISGSASFSGALIGNTMNISGGASVHYDQALANSGGGGSGYTFVSEVEGVR